MINYFKMDDQGKIIELWNCTATKIGYKEMDQASFANIFIHNPYFNEEHTFVMKEDGKVVGFACGCTGEGLPLGKTSGYITCILLDGENETTENYKNLIKLLEKSFVKAGKVQSELLFFNPMMLPWYIKGTNQHEHNNAPGVFVDSRLYKELLKNNYVVRATECAMYVNLENYSIPEVVNAKESKAALSGYEVNLFDNSKHWGVDSMLGQLDNPLWEKEITQCTMDGIPVIIAAYKGQVVGFAGPIIRQENGRGYFTGIGVIKEHEGHGLGTVLFYKLCQALKDVGAEYMSLYTGIDNPAKKIYLQAGFEVVQEFSVMRRVLELEELI